MALEADLAWLRAHTPLTRRAAEQLVEEDWHDHTLCLAIHLDLKMIPVVEALRQTGARVLLLGANPATTRDEVVAWLTEAGAVARAAYGMDDDARLEAMDWAIGRRPTFLSEMGGEVTVRLVRMRPDVAAAVRAGMEATGTGLRRLAEVALPFPVFNWDELPLKQGLHNRHLVGLTVWNTFLNVTGLTLHGRRVLVMGFGPVGRGIADYAQRLGAIVAVADPDPRRQVEARHQGCLVQTLEEALPAAQVVITATGRERVLGSPQFRLLRPGAILLNAGHSNLEIDVPALRRFSPTPVRPHIEAVDLDGGRRVYLLAGGAMFNLAAGPGDPYDAFDLTSAIMLEGIRFMVRRHAEFPPGVHLFPAEVEHAVVANLE